MRITDKQIESRMQRGDSRFAVDRKVSGDSTIDCKNRVLIVGPSGSGKSTFCHQYFKSDGTLLVENDLSSSLKFPIPSFPSSSEDLNEWAITQFAMVVKRALGYWVRSESGRKTYDTGDPFSDIMDSKISKTLLKKRSASTNYQGSGVRIVDEWMNKKIIESSVLPEDFTLKVFWSSRAEFVMELVADSDDFKRTHISAAQSNLIAGMMSTLMVGSILNPDVGMTVEKFESTFEDSDPNGKWVLRIEDTEKTQATTYPKDLPRRPIFYNGSDKFTYDELSTTQRLELYTVLLRTLVRLAGSNMSDTVIALDEPDARIDPASLSYILDFIDLFADAKSVYVTSHNPALLSMCFHHGGYDILEFSRLNGASETKIRQITGNARAIRKVLHRLTNGIAHLSIQESISEGFLKSAPEKNLVFLEGRTDVKLMELAQAVIVDFQLCSIELREFLNNTAIIYLFTDEGDNQSAGSLGQFFKIMFPETALARQDKRAIAIFDADTAGLTASSSIYQSYSDRPGPGKVVRVKSGLKYYANLQRSESVPADLFSGSAGPTVEHLLYHMKGPLALNFSGDGRFSGDKKKTHGKLESFLEACSNDEKEDCLKEFRKLLENLRVALI